MAQIQQFQPKRIKTSRAKTFSPARLRHVFFWARVVLFSAVVLAACALALPALLIGLVLWWISQHVIDRGEYWRGLCAIAALCVVIYVVWIGLSNPLPFLWPHLWFDLGHRLFSLMERFGGLLWLFNIWLGPACALILALLFPKREKALVSVATPKEVSFTEEHEAHARITRQLDRLRQVIEAWKEPSFPQPITPFVSRVPDRAHALGRYLGGELADLVQSGWFCLPPDFFSVHGMLAGEPKAGKSTTLIRLAAIARAFGRRVIFLDLKGSRKTASLFFAAMTMLGVRTFRMYPAQAYDGWRGDAQAIYNRLMQQIDPTSHPFYRSGVGSTIVALACNAPPGPPRNSYEFLRRLDADWLTARYARNAQALRDIDNVVPHLAGASLVFSGFFRGIAGGLDGTWAFEDCDACYIGVDGIAHREEAAMLGRYLLDDAAHFATARKPPEEQALLIIDEFGVLESTNATRLYEGVREAGLCVYAAGQSYQSLGRERDDLLGASPVKILHRCGNPEPFVRYAGKREVYKFSRSIGEAPDDLYHPYANSPDMAAGGILRPQDEYAVPIEDVQQLAQGRIVLMVEGHPASIEVRALDIPPQLVLAANDAILAAGHYQPAVPPPPPPRDAKDAKKTPRKAGLGKKSPGGSGSPGPAGKSGRGAILGPPPPVAPSASQPGAPGKSSPGSGPRNQPQAAPGSPVPEEEDDFDFFC